MKRTIPTFNTDKEAEDFIAKADLSEYDLSGGLLLPPKNRTRPLVLSELR
jgi:CopG antitoxin of type II toxin-antitoxin system